MLNKIRKEILSKSNPEKAKVYQRFFKTGKGEYGEGDVFIGLTVPKSREIANKFFNLDLKDVKELLNSKIHEERLIGLIILVHNYPKEKKSIFDFYLENINRINNWDLVDLTADKIVGDYLIDKEKELLYTLVKSKSLWERRISIVSTFNFIRNNKFEDSLKISEILLKDKHDLIHKAAGWMLREIGKRDQKVLERFLLKHYKEMPRTMLRYAIERFDEDKRRFYLRK